MTKSFLIYGLIDPRNGQLRYVGKSCSGMKRPLRHFQECELRAWPGHKANWIRQLLALSLKPEVVVLETCGSPEELSEAEQFHIAYFRMVGANLTNLTAGGDGIPGCVRSESFCQKLSRHWRGRSKPRQQRILLSRARGGRAILDEAGVIYDSVQDAARQTGMWPTSIIRSLTQGHCAKGHMFKYVEAGHEADSFVA